MLDQHCWCQIVRFHISVPNCPFAFLVPNCPEPNRTTTLLIIFYAKQWSSDQICLCVWTQLGPDLRYAHYTGQFSAKKIDSGNQYTSYHILGPNNCGDIKFGFCLWALFGLYLDYGHHERQRVIGQRYISNHIWRPNNCRRTKFSLCLGLCWARKWAVLIFKNSF